MKLILNSEFNLYEKDGQPLCNSLQVAETFEKRHDNVLVDIRNLDCSENFRLLNFQESAYRNSQNKNQPMYLITKDGFTFLVNGIWWQKSSSI